MHLRAVVLLLIGSAVEIYSAKCLYSPVGKLPTGCSVGNLTWIDAYKRPLIGDLICNSTVDHTLLNTVPSPISFIRFLEPPARRYLLTAIDLTAKRLLWMVSNITVNNLALIPQYNPKMQLLMPYRKPILSTEAQHHVIELLVFEEKAASYYSSYISNPKMNEKGFNLSQWFDTQLNSGITTCGPVAGGSVVAFLQITDPNNNNYQPSRPAVDNHSHPQQNKPKKSSAFRNSFNRCNLTLIFLLLKVIFF